MSIENPKYFAAGDAGGGSEKNNEQKQAPEKKEIKIDPNNFDEEEIENIFKDQETTETTKTAKEEKPEEPQQTPEQQPKDEVEKFFVEQIQADRHFFSKDITPKEFRTWQEITQTDFKTFSEEKQKILMEMLANELGKNSNLIENAQKDLESKTIDKKEKDELEKGLKEYLQPLQKALRARTQVYHLALHPEKQPEKPPEIFKVQTETHKDFNKINELLSQAEVILQNKNLELEPQEKKELLEEYAKEMAKILNVPPEKIYLTDLINNRENLNQFFEVPQKEKVEDKKEKTEKPLDKQLDTILKGIGEGKINPDTFLKFISTPGASESISKILNSPEFQEGIKKPENQNKLKAVIEKFQKFISKEKGKPKPEAVEKVKEFIKSEEKKGKESIFQKMGGWGTVGGGAASILMILLILIFLGEFKLLEKATGIEMGGGEKGGKGGKY